MAEQTDTFAGKVAFVTGSSSGIGRATALAFAAAGASVALADIFDEENQETARRIEESGGRALTLTCDVTSGDDVRTALDRTVTTFGRLDAAFNNAGIEQPVGPTIEITEHDWDRIIGVNLRGVFLGI